MEARRDFLRRKQRESALVELGAALRRRDVAGAVGGAEVQARGALRVAGELALARRLCEARVVAAPAPLQEPLRHDAVPRRRAALRHRRVDEVAFGGLLEEV